MNDLHLSIITPADSLALSRLLTDDGNDYSQYFIPFATDIKSLEKQLEVVREDRYWGICFNGILAGFFMMRGLDEGYKRPSFGVADSSSKCNSQWWFCVTYFHPE